MAKRVCYRILLISIALLVVSQARAQRVAISNNLIWSSMLTPNLSLQVRPDSAWSLGLTGGYRPWPTNDETARKYRHLAVQLEARHWNKEHPFLGEYYGFDAMWVHYNLSNLELNYFGMFNDARHRRMQGNLYALGAFGGYAWNLGSGFAIEAQGGLDLAWTHYRLYDLPHCGDPIAKKNKLYLLPKVALNISYHF